MIRTAAHTFGLALFALTCCPMTDSDAQENSKARLKELQALVDFLKAKGVELRPADGKVEGSYIQVRFTVGPDHKKQHVVGLNYLPPLTQKEAREKYVGYSLPHEFHGDWAVFMIGGPGGNATPEYQADWKRILAALREYPGPAKQPGK